LSLVYGSKWNILKLTNMQGLRLLELDTDVNVVICYFGKHKRFSGVECSNVTGRLRKK